MCHKKGLWTFLPLKIEKPLFLFRARKSDLVYIFQVWCESIDQAYRLGQQMGPENYQFDVLSADLYGLIADNLTPLSQTNVDAFAVRSLSLPEKNRYHDLDRPDPNILKRLACELGFEISDTDEQKENVENGLAYSDLKLNDKIVQQTDSRKPKKKKKLKSVANRIKLKLVQNFVPDDNVELIKDLTKPVMDSSSESEESTATAQTSKGKRKRKMTWKLRVKEKSKKTKKIESDFSDSSPEPVKEEEEVSSDEYVPTSKF